MSATQKQEKTLEQKTLGRRELLKVLAATGGAVTAAAMVPGTWAKPVIEAGVMPAHAATSLLAGNLRVSLNWNVTGINFDLHLVDPCDGQDVFGGNPTSTTLQHGGGVSPVGGGYTETCGVKEGMVAPGSYLVYVRYVGDNDPAFEYVNYTIDTGSESKEHTDVYFTTNSGHTNGYGKKICRIVFPGGHITSLAPSTSTGNGPYKLIEVV